MDEPTHESEPDKPEPQHPSFHERAATAAVIIEENMKVGRPFTEAVLHAAKWFN
ncbi:hypothetical protein [Actinomadura mexicana]|uniref:Uncharacterized protein n=1 Tax=Actinomadura mexicana TaxID=134959 RepID=A0A238XC08_9ACTN|nr:hypothetical protein [Actinomadura mexicana]SNR56132.1 hypothetical protein SAMN06265355_104159 [Actinomadura mexicana]